MENVSTKFILYKSKGTNKEGKYPVKLRVIWNRIDKNYRTGINLTEKEFENIYQKRSLKKNLNI